MKTNGVNTGFLREFVLARNVVSPGNGGTVLFKLDALPDQVDGLIPHVLELQVKLSRFRMTLTAAKVTDALSLWQFIKTIRLSLADGAPPTQNGGDRELINAMEGWRAAMMLAYMSGRPVVRGMGGDVVIPGALAAGSVTSDFVATPTRQGHEDLPLQMQGPFHSGASAATAAVDDSIEWILPVGYRFGEGMRNAIPGSYFTGKPGGRMMGDAGELELTLDTTVDNIAVTNDTTATFEIVAICVMRPIDKGEIVPMVPRLAKITDTVARVTTQPGLRACLWLQKPLSSGGMATHAFVRVLAEQDGVPLGDALVERRLRALHSIEPAGAWRPTRSETSSSHAAAARTTRFGVPILQWRGDANLAPGSQHAGVTLTFEDPGSETTWYISDGVFVPVNDAVVARAKEWSVNPAAQLAVPNTKNGNHASPALAAIVPNELKKAA